MIPRMVTGIGSHTNTQDYQGQNTAFRLARSLLTLAGVLSFVIGFILQDMKTTLFLYVGLVALTAVVSSI